MSDVALLRLRLRVALFSPLACAVLGLACSHGSNMPSCPSGDLCTTTDQVEGRRQTPEQWLGCPKYVTWNRDTDAGFPPAPDRPVHGEGSLDMEATRKKRVAGASDACCYHWYQPCPGGRPLVDGGRTLLPEVHAGAALDDDEGHDRDLDPETRAALAAAWLDDARAEHASVASFTRAALELLAVGAPPDLVAATRRASLDEIRHAERCFALASRYAGRALGPGRLPEPPPREADLARLARDTFAEGCVAETLATLCAQRALEEATDASVRAALAEIAEDEASHAGLAWTTLAWAVRAGGATVREALRALAATMRGETADEAPRPGPAPDDARGARHGRLTVEAHRKARRDAWEGIVEPMLAELLALAEAGAAVRSLSSRWLEARAEP